MTKRGNKRFLGLFCHKLNYTKEIRYFHEISKDFIKMTLPILCVSLIKYHLPGAAPHYGSAMPSQQAHPMDDTFVSSHVGTDSTDWFGWNSQNNDEDLYSVVRPKNTSSSASKGQSTNFTSGNPGSSTSASEKGKSTNFSKKNSGNWSLSSITGFVSSLFGASPQEPQFSPSMHDTSAASSYYPSNQPDDQTLQSMVTSRNPSSMPYQQVPPMQDTFVSSHVGTDSTDFFGWNSQNNDEDLASVVRPKNTSLSASKDFDATAHLPNQSQSTEMLDFSNTAPFPQAPQIAQQSFNFTSGNPGSSTSAVNKGKSINFSKNSGNWPLSSITGKGKTRERMLDGRPNLLIKYHLPGSSSHYGGAIPFQQVPMPGTLIKYHLPGASSHYGDAMPFQQVPPMDDTFVPFQAGTDSTNWFEEMQSNDGDLYSVVRPKNTSSSKGFDGTPFLPNQSQSTEFWDFSNPAPPSSQAPQIAQQSSNFTSGNPGSSTSASEKGKSTNFSSALNKGKSTNFSSALNKGKSTNFSKKNPGNWSLSSITGFVSNLVGASPQEPQFSPSIHDTSAASSYYPSNQPDDGTLGSMITPRNQKDSSSYYGSAMPYQQVPPVQDTFVPSQTGTDSTNFFGGNLQNNDGDLASVFRPNNTSSSKGFYGTPFLPNQSQSTGWPGTSNFFSPTPNTSNFTLGNPGSSTYYGSAIPSQQAPMPGTSFPSFPNYPSNQSAQLNSSTNFVPSQPGTPSLDWSGGNSQNNEGDLYSMFNTRKPRSEKKGKKPRK
ncbi:hypothetical protein GPALN_005888 [Globodera pallida]|nr:hypothetical protein GPALN_005888 [Globodera pallida]